MKVTGVILAGGRATRMGGGDKGLLMLGGQTLLARVIARLGPQVSQLALNANGDPEHFADLELPVLPDAGTDRHGPLAGVLAGLDWAATLDGVTHIITAAVDTPFFPTDLVERLTEAAKAEAKSIALAATPGDGKPLRHPTFGLWPVALRDDLRDALAGGLRKVVMWTDAHGAATAMFPSDPIDPFFNVNTLQDLAAAEGMIA